MFYGCFLTILFIKILFFTEKHIENWPITIEFDNKFLKTGKKSTYNHKNCKTLIFK